MKKIKMPVMYANQFVPLWDKVGLFERIEKFGRMDKKCSGGSILHCQVSSQTTPKQNERIITEAVKNECEHFAINAVYSRCMDCGEVVDHKVGICEKCGSQKIDYLTRVVGFFVPLSSFNKTRREHDFPNRYFADDSLM